MLRKTGIAVEMLLFFRMICSFKFLPPVAAALFALAGASQLKK
jgi:hypothetical protein